jgi:hypothetical protein
MGAEAGLAMVRQVVEMRQLANYGDVQRRTNGRKSRQPHDEASECALSSFHWYLDLAMDVLYANLQIYVLHLCSSIELSPDIWYIRILSSQNSTAHSADSRTRLCWLFRDKNITLIVSYYIDSHFIFCSKSCNKHLATPENIKSKAQERPIRNRLSMYPVYEFSCPIIGSVESGNEGGNRASALPQLRVASEPRGRDYQASHPDPSLQQQKIPNTDSICRPCISHEMRTGKANITQLTGDLDFRPRCCRYGDLRDVIFDVKHHLFCRRQHRRCVMEEGVDPGVGAGFGLSCNLN